MKINLETKLSAKGYYKFIVKDAYGNEIDKGFTVPTANVVTNGGRRLFFANASTRTGNEANFEGPMYLIVGDGASERTVSASTLSNELSISRVSVDNRTGTGFTDNEDGTETYKRIMFAAFPLGDIVGTVTEAGVFTGTSGNNLVAGQLLKDGAGDPTTITLLADEQLTVEYTVEWTYTRGAQSGGTGTVGINSVSEGYSVEFSGIRKGGGFWAIPSSSFSDSFSQSATFYDSTDNLLFAGNCWGGRSSPSTGTWTDNASIVASPADFDTTDLRKVGIFSDGSAADGKNVNDTRGSLAVITFDNPLTKTASDALTFDIDITYSVV